MRCSLCLLWLSLTCHAASAAEQPNILFILVDDLAWSDLGSYGHSWHETPHMDRLAAEGLRFEYAYASAPICSASRASLLTGKSPARLHFEFVTKNAAGQQTRLPGQTLQSPPFTLNLPLEETTIAERLTELGYATAFFGKWHLNAHYQQYLGWSPEFGPPQQGFETAIEDFGSHPYRNRRNTRLARVGTAGHFHADSLTQKMIKFLHRQHDRPWFLFASHFYVHTPVETPYDWLIQKYDGVIPADAPNRQKRIRYAAFLESLDHYVGQLLTAVETAGFKERTVVILTSDNGGHPEYTANGPLRGSKWNLYEGGIRVPMIIRWPGTIAAGSKTSVPVIGYDMLPTLVHMAGGTIAEEEQLDGSDLTRVLLHLQPIPKRLLHWHFPYYHPEKGYADSLPNIGVDDFAVSQTKPQSAVREGDWKLVYFYEDDRSELYNLATDPSEQRNLADSHAEFTTRLRRKLLQSLYSEEAGVQARRPQPVTVP